jgi:hypothetical protein
VLSVKTEARISDEHPAQTADSIDRQFEPGANGNSHSEAESLKHFSTQARTQTDEIEVQPGNVLRWAGTPSKRR